MKSLSTVINSLVASIITTALILMISFIVMLFSSGDEGYRTIYFGGLFFENYNISEDLSKMEFGVANGNPIIITFVILSFLYFLVFLLSKKKLMR